MRHYPDLSSKLMVPLQVIREQLKLDPGYLDAEECPYDAAIKDLLRLMVSPTGVSQGGFLNRTGSKQHILEEEAQALYQEIKSFGSKLKADDVSERMTYYRTRTSLLEKLIDMIERAGNMQAVVEFQEIVLAIFEDMLTPEQRAEAMERLSSAIEPQGDHG